MEIYTEITDLRQRFPKIAVVLGTFDGVHLGHRQIISRAVELAKSINGKSVVFTFSNHPLSVVAPDRCPLQIGSQESKAALIEDIGVDVLLTIPFTPEFAKLSPEDFLTLLHDTLDPKYVVVGPNYSFGYKSSGTPEILKSSGKKYGFEVEVLDAFQHGNNIISSTAIRQLISEGHVACAAKLLGRLFIIEGPVIQGAQRGRELGYPTANLAITKGQVIPADGVYATRVFIDGKWYNSIANVGTNPTFQESDRRLEVYIFLFHGNLYDKIIKVGFVRRIRNEQKFNSPDELIAQIKRDVNEAEQYLCNNNCSVV